MRVPALAGLTALACLTATRALCGQTASVPDIPYKKYTLRNGLTLLVHEDHKAPIATVNIWYHVGSKNEKAGKTGFAHLFEHLMFNGSENYNDDYFKAVEPLGATDLNGTTNEDRTNYFQNVPVSALDRILWLESDRMGHLLGAIDTARLNEQRGVVQNEKRQGENEPYGKAWITIAENTFPKGHPYSWSVIGSMDDLNAASLEDVKDWFRTYYGPSNAVLVVAGDIASDDVKARVEKYFGDIPPGPPVIAHDKGQPHQLRFPEPACGQWECECAEHWAQYRQRKRQQFGVGSRVTWRQKVAVRRTIVFASRAIMGIPRLTAIVSVVGLAPTTPGVDAARPMCYLTNT